MILTNDSFSSIVTAVEEGRRIYENLKKFVWFIFSCNIGELFLIFAAIVFQFPLPLTAILILCVDLGTDILPAIAPGGRSRTRRSHAKASSRCPSKIIEQKVCSTFFNNRNNYRSLRDGGIFVGDVAGRLVVGRCDWWKLRARANYRLHSPSFCPTDQYLFCSIRKNLHLPTKRYR